jgi:hypothetical protein
MTILNGKPLTHHYGYGFLVGLNMATMLGMEKKDNSKVPFGKKKNKMCLLLLPYTDL